MDIPWSALMPALVFLLATTIILGGFWMAGGRKLALGIQARHWSHTTGQILRVKSEPTGEDQQSTRMILVCYAYAVGSHKYEGTVIHPIYGHWVGNQADNNLQSLLQSAQQVRVYYDPALPSCCALSTWFHLMYLAPLFAILTTLGVVGGIVLEQLHSFPRLSVALLLGSIVGGLIGYLILASDRDIAGGITVIK